MALTDIERSQLVSLIHKMSPADGDNLFGMQVLVRTSPTDTKTAIVTSAVENDLTEAEGITALDALPSGTRAAAAVRWAV